MPNKSPRLISLRVLEEVTVNGAYSGIALSNELDKNVCLNKTERAFITELTNGVLRNITLIDYVIARFSSVPPNKMKPVVRNILRQSVYEIMFMASADYAVCSEAVKMTKARGLGGLGGFVNGVLRSVVRQRANIPLPDEREEPALYLSTTYSHPKWIVEKWLAEYGYDFTKKLLAKNNEPPKVSVCVNTLKTSLDSLAEALLLEGISSEKSHYAKNGLILESPGSITQLECYKKGLFHVQDIASQIAVEILAPRKGDTLVDLCAAPGGKSFFAAYLMKNSGKIYAGDIHVHKTGLIAKGADRLGINIIETKTHDATDADETLFGIADCVIVDAPCSGLGVMRKKPDIRINRRPGNIEPLQTLQRSILNAGANYVKKGGSLLYSTCTLTKEENEENANWFSENFDFEMDETAPDNLSTLVKNGSVTLFPHIHDTDGFFICKFIKRN